MDLELDLNLQINSNPKNLFFTLAKNSPQILIHIKITNLNFQHSLSLLNKIRNHFNSRFH